jgi:UDP-N-acetylglucosamine acyltransferase
MSMIDPMARVAPGAVIGENTAIGPFCTVGPNVVIGPGSRLISHVNIDGHTTIGARATIYPFASLGTPPQSLKHKGEPTRLEIGEDCVIRESVTMGCGTVEGGGITRVGDRAFIMAYCHVGHDCHVGNDVITANYVAFGGHTHVGDHVFVGAFAGTHQFVRIGAQAMIGGRASIRGDVIPYAMVNGDSEIEGLNIVGMRRRKFTKERLRAVRAFYRALFFGDGMFAERLEALASQAASEPAIAEIITFIRDGKNRPLMKPPRDRAGAAEEQ